MAAPQSRVNSLMEASGGKSARLLRHANCNTCNNEKIALVGWVI